jgi:D-alanyl-D-alanine carboxypeptidase (penicillin-binding protein 5/6)
MADPTTRSARDTARRRVLTACVVAALLAVALVVTAHARTASGTTVTGRASAPTVKARSFIVIDRRSGKVLGSKSADLRLEPASCAKIMTALLVLEHYHDLGRMVRAPAGVAEHQVVAIGLQTGDRISVLQALRALMVKSANDAALTLASAVSGSESRFVTLMNRRARALGLTHTHFVNCRGTPRPGLFSSARDLATLGRVAMRDARFRDLVGTKTRVITWPPSHAVTVTSHNRLLDQPWADGIKTGSTEQTKKILVGSGKPGLVPLIVVTMREPTRDLEQKDAVALFMWGSALYERRQIVAGHDVVAELAVSGDTPVAAVAKSSLSAVVRKAAKVTHVLRLLQPEPLLMRPAAGTTLGTVTYRSDGVVLGRVELLAATIPAASPGP